MTNMNRASQELFVHPLTFSGTDCHDGLGWIHYSTAIILSDSLVSHGCGAQNICSVKEGARNVR